MTLDPLVGQQLANFRIERVIGRGGMGQIYAGMDVKLERPVAIKVIDTRHRGDPGYAERFIREARAIAAWRHENIIQIFYADDQDGLYYFVMELIDGEDLGQLIARHAREGRLIEQREVVRIGRALAGALDYAHGKGVIHRDVKPSNVMVAGDGRVVLMDFGLALDAQQGSVGEVFGSSRYIAPEQARRSSDAVPQSDLYALGVVLYELLTGAVPFDDPSPTSVALQHLTLPPPPPRQVNPSLSVAIEEVVLKALAKTPGERYASGAELIDALERAVLIGQSQPLVSSDNLIGQQLGDYQIEGMLGRGGMAHIYRGRDSSLKRQVAIKVIDTPFRQDAEYVGRFQREAQAIASLEHPNIVRLYQYGEAQGVLYIAMEFVDGTNLEELLRRHRLGEQRLSNSAILRLLREICSALDYAHGKGVIHRDVKPSNVMVAGDGRAVLTDFGLALIASEGTRGEIFGSPHYVAPEQAISSASAVGQSDLYSVGVILYELFAGRVPFDGADAMAIAMQHMTDPPPPPRELEPGISAELEQALLKMLAKDPAERYPTGAALASVVEHALHEAPTAGYARPNLPPPPVVARPGGPAAPAA
ncbi:MAG TPA: serine/threonine-protein kinase, partial [Herpetosiphonaceae bacterium]